MSLQTNPSSITQGIITTKDDAGTTTRGHQIRRPKGSMLCSKCKKLIALPNVNGELRGQIKCYSCHTINEV